MKRLCMTLALLLCFMTVSVHAAEEEKVLYVYNWSEYMPQSVLDQFTEETGIKVIYSTYESNEAMFAKLKLLEGKGYDIVVPSTYFVALMREQGLLSKIEKSKLTNFGNLDSTVQGGAFDPSNEYSVPYMWGSVGMMINSKDVDPATITSWNDMRRPEFKGRLLLSNDMRDTMGIALKALGYSVNSRNEAEIKAAYEYLQALKPSVLVFNVESTKQAFIGEEVVIGMSWNGDAVIAMDENPNLRFVYPKEGVPLWLDSLCIPSGAAHKDNAHKFIDFTLRPDIAKVIVEEFLYSTPNTGAQALLSDDLKENNAVSPTKENLVNAEFTTSVGDAQSIYEKYWEMLKTN